MKQRHLIILTAVALFAIYAFSELSQSLNPYVSFAEAKTNKSTVQVKGSLLKDPTSITYENQELRFLLRDEKGEQVQVSYHGAKPDNFEHADSVVVIGKYNGSEFTAEKLLVKCPSKYERKGASS